MRRAGLVIPMATARPILSPLALRDASKDARYLVAVSGGRDSSALLHALFESGYEKLIVCHLDHNLRARSSRADARFVATLAERLGLSCEIGSTDVRALAAREKLSLETAGRAARYAFFAAVARRRRCGTIFLGHHADDLVETFLLNLFRGAGLAGLSSLREVSTLRLDRTDLTLIRPLLATRRREIDRYLRSNELRFREDATNQDLGPLRNRLRHRILPYLEKTFGREISLALRRTALIAAEEHRWMESLLPPIGAELSVKTLRDQPLAAQRRILRNWLRGHEVTDLRFEMIERVRALLEPNHAVAKTNLPGSRHVRRRAGKIFVEPPIHD